MLNISAILLGAGESKRMGKEKLSLPWGKKTIFEHCLRTLLRSRAGEVVVVLKGPMEEMTLRMRKKKVKVVFNRDYKKGMSASIRRGIRALDSKSNGILIGLGDQPFVKTQTINALIGAFKKGKGGIIVPSFKGRRGHPVIFHRRYEKELLRLRGDTGARRIMDRYPHDVWEVPVKSEGVIKDIDTWEDYRKELKIKR
ncbi:MAG: molybdenum cofactor cytidylyltransferase [Deltaproteobacteria bacterium RBG_16_49_23]|nr:MAG: molybdenum cofactor cytidylyltransferase [Deltaproteobacteria bacterium RBG_16_49_23]